MRPGNLITVVAGACLQLSACRSASSDALPAATSVVAGNDTSRRTIPVASPVASPDAMELVVRDSALWRAIWPTIRTPRSESTTLPKVDFDTEIVAVMAMGAQGSNGSSVVIDSVVYVGDSRATVHYRHVMAPLGCRAGSLGGADFPAVAVRLRRPHGAVYFVRDVVRLKCG